MDPTTEAAQKATEAAAKLAGMSHKPTPGKRQEASASGAVTTLRETVNMTPWIGGDHDGSSA